ncbi:MAG: dihydroorotate dehydrogenase [Candidatus Omnitrophica bacterium]|nr:dihydroorotate dehydrogenase [Candidatus Omnitrophota bacterium]MCM8791381.1 dihydroorotate dehydrogenase [Candidatus Omnitrophota bacterium]
MVDLSVKIGKLRLKNPVMVASGTWGIEYDELTETDLIGAVVLKTITLEERSGNLPPRIAETASGMLNSIGLENKGVEDFIRNKLPAMSGLEAPIVVSIAGDDEKQFSRLARSLSRFARVNALEVNLSCPNIKYGLSEGLIAQDEKATYRVVKAVRAATDLTVIVKLSPNVTDIGKIAKAAEAAGADALSVANTFIAMAVDVDTWKPKLGNVTGGLSGPAIKPLSLRAVWEAAKKTSVPIIGIGGIMNASDAVEFMLCGASAVQVGTANFVNPQTPAEIVKGLEIYMKKRGIKNIKSLIGSLKMG